MPPISKQELVALVMARGLPDRGTAEDAIVRMFAVLGPHLTADEALALGRRVSPALARLFGREPAEITPRDEHVQIALRALGELLDGEMFDRLRRVLPEELARHLAPPSTAEVSDQTDGRVSDGAVSFFARRV